MSNTTTNDGGSAFPVCDAGTSFRGPLHGMTLRDYFAGQALIGLLAHGAEIDHERGIFLTNAVTAYRYSDAMLEARQLTDV